MGGGGLMDCQPLDRWIDFFKTTEMPFILYDWGRSIIAFGQDQLFFYEQQHGLVYCLVQGFTL